MKFDLFLVLYTFGGIVLVGFTYIVLGAITEAIGAANKKRVEEELKKKQDERNRRNAV